MGKLERSAKGRNGKKGGQSATGLVAALAALLVISGCSSVPDYVNPVEWYNSTVDFFDDDAPPPLPAEAVPGANEPFPALTDIAEPPLREIELRTLEAVGEGLVADRANAQYTDSVIRAGGVTVLAETPPLPTPQLAPVPAPQPRTAEPVPPVESVSQQAAFQPAPMKPAALGRLVDVKTMFAKLFTSSGPRAVAPAASGTQLAMALATAPSASSPGLPSSVSLISLDGGLASGAGPLFGANKAAVIYFGLGSARIDKGGRDALDKVAQYHEQRGGTLRVVGHASSRTKELSPARHEMVNFNISFKRARAVADELIRRGVAPDKLVVVAMSASAPVYQEWMPSGEAGNRRAEVFIDF